MQTNESKTTEFLFPSNIATVLRPATLSPSKSRILFADRILAIKSEVGIDIMATSIGIFKV